MTNRAAPVSGWTATATLRSDAHEGELTVELPPEAVEFCLRLARDQKLKGDADLARQFERLQAIRSFQEQQHLGVMQAIDDFERGIVLLPELPAGPLPEWLDRPQA